MDYVAKFLDEHGIEYRVAGGHNLVFYAGLGFVLVIVLIIAREKGVSGVKRVLPVLAIILLGFPVLPIAWASPAPQEPPPTFYGWVTYTDGTPAPPGVVITAVTTCGNFTTRTGQGTTDPNAYILKIDIQYENEDCDGKIVVMNETVWQGHMSTFMLVKLNITISNNGNASGNASLGDPHDIVRLSASLDKPVATENINIRLYNSNYNNKLYEAGAIAFLLLLFIIFRREVRR